MKALTFHGKENIVFESVPDPHLLDPGDVIVKVQLCAICGSDLHVYHERETGMDVGTTMGHEFMGEVVEPGKSVKTLRAGDLVMSPFTTNCGSCYYCLNGLTCRCVKGQLYGWVEKGEGLAGGQAGFVRVPMAESTLMKIPEGVTAEEGLLLGDIISTGFYCARQAEIKADGAYAVIGCGPVGLMAILGAQEYGAEKIFALDTVKERLKIAEGFGATSIDINSEDPKEAVLAATQGRGADAVMEAVGNEKSGSMAYDILRPGGIFSSVGVCHDPHLPFSPVQAYNKNITYKVGRCPARDFMEKLTPLVQKKKYNFASVITHRMSLSDGPVGYDLFSIKKDKCLKVVFKP